MGVRRQAREAALQAIFMCDFHEQWNEEAPIYCLNHFAVNKGANDYASLLSLGVLKNLKDIDEKITIASDHWSISRMGRVDRTILRIATFEMFFLDDIPVNVAINEAIEVAKRYGADESPTFVNGVLDKIAASTRKNVTAPIEDDLIVEPAADEGSTDEVIS